MVLGPLPHLKLFSFFYGKNHNAIDAYFIIDDSDIMYAR